MDCMCSSFTHKWPYNFEASVVVVAAVAISSEEEKETDRLTVGIGRRDPGQH